MISPFTPPGTKVVCVRLNRSAKRRDELPKLVKGAIYTVADMIETKNAGFAVLLVETMHAHGWRKEGWIGFRRKVRYAYSRACFRRAQLPSVFTEILAGQPISKDAHDPKVEPPPKVKVPERAQ